MVTFKEIAAHSVDHMFSFDLAITNISNFPCWIWVLIASFPDILRDEFLNLTYKELDVELLWNEVEIPCLQYRFE